jgi:predicted transcriptional regulator
MAVEKFSVSLEPDLGRALRQAAEEENVTVSSWMAEAARQRLRNLMLGQALDEIITDEGWTWEELIQEATNDEAEVVRHQVKKSR